VTLVIVVLKNTKWNDQAVMGL